MSCNMRLSPLEVTVGKEITASWTDYFNSYLRNLLDFHWSDLHLSQCFHQLLVSEPKMTEYQIKKVGAIL